MCRPGIETGWESELTALSQPQNATNKALTPVGVGLLFNGVLDHFPESLRDGLAHVLRSHLGQLESSLAEEARFTKELGLILLDALDTLVLGTWGKQKQTNDISQISHVWSDRN